MKKSILWMLILLLLCSFTFGANSWDVPEWKYYWLAGTPITEDVKNGLNFTNTDVAEVAGFVDVSGDFNSSSDQLETSFSITAISSGLTISFWAKPDSMSSDQAILDTADGGNNNRIYIEAQGDDNGELRWWVKDSSNDIYINHNDYTDPIFEVGKWVFITVTYDGDATLKIYVNGTLNQSKTGVSLGTITPTTNLFVDNDHDGSKDFDGIIDELSIWYTELTPAQVTDLFNQGVNGNRLNDIDSSLNSWNISSARVFYSLDDSDTDGSICIDSVPGTFNATIDGATTGEIGQINEAYSFDGVNDEVYVSGMYDKDTLNMTYSAWFKTADTTIRAAIISNHKDVAHYATMLLYYNPGAAGHGTCYAHQNGAGTQESSCVSFEAYNVTDNNWHHVVIVRNGSGASGLHVYIDGFKRTVDGVDNENLGSIGLSGSTFRIGRLVDGFGTAAYFNGTIDEVIVWNKTLSAEQILDLYNQGDAGLRADYEAPPPVAQINITDINCTSSDPDDTEVPFKTTDTTPSFSLTTSIPGTCSISDTNGSYADCSTTGQLHHICTINSTQELNYGTDYVYINCTNASDNTITRKYEMFIQSTPSDPIVHFPTNGSSVNTNNVTLNFTVINEDGSNMNVSIYGTGSILGEYVTSFQTNITGKNNSDLYGISVFNNTIFIGDYVEVEWPGTDQEIIIEFYPNGTYKREYELGQGTVEYWGIAITNKTIMTSCVNTGGYLINYTRGGIFESGIEYTNNAVFRGIDFDVNSNDMIWALDLANDKIFKYYVNGSEILNFSTKPYCNYTAQSYCFGMMNDKNYIYVTNRETGEIHRFLRNGSYVDNPFNVIESNNVSRGIDADDNYFYITNRDTNEIYVYTYEENDSLILLNTQLNVANNSVVTYEWQNLTDGTTYEWYITLTGAAGTTTSITYEFTIDQTNPSITDVNCTSSPYQTTEPYWANTTTPSFSITTDETTTCGISNTNSSYNRCTNVNSLSHSCTINTTQALSEGSGYVYFNCSDNATNYITKKYSVFIDSIRPIGSFDSPASGRTPVINMSGTFDTIDMVTTFYDNINLVNITMYVNGTLNATNSSPINNTAWTVEFQPYKYTNYTIYFKGCDNVSNCNVTETRWFYVTQPFNSINLTVNGYSLPKNYEIGTQIQVEARLSGDWDIVCIGINGTYLSTNYSCSSGAVNYYAKNLTLEYVTESQFNDSTTDQNLTVNKTVRIDMFNKDVIMLSTKMRVYGYLNGSNYPKDMFFDTFNDGFIDLIIFGTLNGSNGEINNFANDDTNNNITLIPSVYTLKYLNTSSSIEYSSFSFDLNGYNYQDPVEYLNDSFNNTNHIDLTLTTANINDQTLNTIEISSGIVDPAPNYTIEIEADYVNCTAFNATGGVCLLNRTGVWTLTYNYSTNLSDNRKRALLALFNKEDYGITKYNTCTFSESLTDPNNVINMTSLTTYSTEDIEKYVYYIWAEGDSWIREGCISGLKDVYSGSIVSNSNDNSLLWWNLSTYASKLQGNRITHFVGSSTATVGSHSLQSSYVDGQGISTDSDTTNNYDTLGYYETPINPIVGLDFSSNVYDQYWQVRHYGDAGSIWLLNNSNTFSWEDDDEGYECYYVQRTTDEDVDCSCATNKCYKQTFTAHSEWLLNSKYQQSAWVYSTKLNTGTYNITKIRGIWHDERPAGTDITYYVSSDGGTNWVRMYNNSIVYISENYGNDLRWRAYLKTNINGTTPRIFDINISIEENYPENLRIDIGADGTDDYTYTGVVNKFIKGSININKINDYISQNCNPSTKVFCEIPVNIYSISGGILNVQNLSLTYNIDEPLDIHFNNTYFEEQNTNQIPINVTFIHGAVYLDELEFDYLGRDNVSIAATSSGNNSYGTLEVFYSIFNYTFPNGITFFMPQIYSSTQTNAVPYGQESDIPIFNVSSYKYQYPYYLYMYLNTTIDNCIDVYFEPLSFCNGTIYQENLTTYGNNATHFFANYTRDTTTIQMRMLSTGTRGPKVDCKNVNTNTWVNIYDDSTTGVGGGGVSPHSANYWRDGIYDTKGCQLTTGTLQCYNDCSVKPCINEEALYWNYSIDDLSINNAIFKLQTYNDTLNITVSSSCIPDIEYPTGDNKIKLSTNKTRIGEKVDNETKYVGLWSWTDVTSCAPGYYDLNPSIWTLCEDCIPRDENGSVLS